MLCSVIRGIYSCHYLLNVCLVLLHKDTIFAVGLAESGLNLGFVTCGLVNITGM